MELVAPAYESFFHRAAADGWVVDASAPRDSRRGWAHTLVEYSVDQHLADTKRLHDTFRAVRAAAGSVNTADLDRWLTAFGAQVSKPFPAQPARTSA